jgi:integrase
MAYFQKVDAKNKQGYKWKCTEDASRDPITGKRRQVTRRADTKKEAQKKVDEAIEELIRKEANGVNSSLENITVNELFERWFELTMKRRLKETTFREYFNATNYRILPVLGNYKVKKLNALLLQKFINDLTDEGLSARYIEYLSTILYGALEAARKWKIIQVNPLIDVEKPRPRRVKQKIWSKEELHHFLEVTKLSNPRLAYVVSTASRTGGRRGEVLSLKWTDIESNDLTFERSLVYNKEGYKFTTPKSESSIRTIKIGNSLIQDLKEWKIHQNKMKMAFRHTYKDEGLIFATQTGKPIYPRSLTSEFNQAIKIANVPKIRFHDLRHTHATMCLESGMSLKEVQDRLGHSSIRTTGDVYAHVTDSMREKSVELLEKFLSN